MHEQQLADLLSEQIDRMLQGEADLVTPDIEDLQALLDLGKQFSQTQFQASAAAQTAFLSQLAGWFGLANGGSAMTILGLSKAWFIAIISTITVVVGLGFLAVLTTTVIVLGPISQAPATIEVTDSPVMTDTNTTTTTLMITPPIMTDTTTLTTTITPTATATITPTSTITPPVAGLPPTLIFISELRIIQLCQGAYTTQRTLVNYGNLPVTDGAMVWEVIEGAELVETVDIGSDSLEAAMAGAGGAATVNVADVGDAPYYGGFANFQSISVKQKVKLDVKVKVKDAWWDQEDGAEIKVRLSVKNKLKLKHEFEIEQDFKLKGRIEHDDDDDDDGSHRDAGQIITIVKQGAEWVTLTGPAHLFGHNTLLVNGHLVKINPCTGLPPTLPPGSNVNVIAILLPDGTFSAINITIINVNIVNVNFDSGVPTGGDSDDGDDDGGGGGGGDGGGSKGGGGRSGDHDRGHGNDSDGFDEDNPGKSHR